MGRKGDSSEESHIVYFLPFPSFSDSISSWHKSPKSNIQKISTIIALLLLRIEHISKLADSRHSISHTPHSMLGRRRYSGIGSEWSKMRESHMSLISKSSKKLLDSSMLSSYGSHMESLSYRRAGRDSGSPITSKRQDMLSFCILKQKHEKILIRSNHLEKNSRHLYTLFRGMIDLDEPVKNSLHQVRQWRL